MTNEIRKIFQSRAAAYHDEIWAYLTGEGDNHTPDQKKVTYREIAEKYGIRNGWMRVGDFCITVGSVDDL